MDGPSLPRIAGPSTSGASTPGRRSAAAAAAAVAAALGSAASRRNVPTAVACGGGRGGREEQPGPALRFGAIADVQYADIDDAWNFARTQMRGYRGALDVLRRAVEEWMREPRLDFVVDLGDIIDQSCETKGDSRVALTRVLREWEPIQVPVYHLIGNHELYNFNRAECEELIPNIAPWYRSLIAKPGWRVVILDAYDLNIIERGGGSVVEDGMAYLSQHNPNDLRAPRGTIDLGKGLVGLQRRFLPMGGALGAEQLRWLSEELRKAQAEGERVIVFSHVPVHPEATVPGALVWNYDEVLKVLREPEEGTVALVLAGHYHPGGYAIDKKSGTHHVTLPSPLHAESSDPRAHCVVEVFEDRVEVIGRGLVPCSRLPLQRQRQGMATARL